jgi:hypothetical protein
MPDILFWDIETRSTVDLRKTGPFVYAEDPMTDVIVACYAFNDEGVETWWAGDPCPERIRTHIEGGGKWVAHNALFEFTLCENVLAKRYGWPVFPFENAIDTAASAASMALPRSLDGVGGVLGLDQQKDADGHRLMLRMCKPRKVNPDGSVVWWTDADRMSRLRDYCALDVEVERQVYKRLPWLNETEQKVYALDGAMNRCGVRVDIELVKAARDMALRVVKQLDRDMAEATNYEVGKTSMVLDLMQWLSKHYGIETDTVDKHFVRRQLEDPNLPPQVRRVLEIRREAAKTSTSKYKSFLDRTSSDNRIRDTLMYHGASTGRWCLPGDSEVLTQDAGWVRLDKFTSGRIAQWTPDRRVKFAKAVSQSFGSDSDTLSNMVQVTHPHRSDVSMTPEHILPAYDKAGAFKPTTAFALLTTPNRRIPISGTLTSPPKVSTLHTRILVMLQHDGYDGDYAVEWGFQKQRKSTRCQKLLASAGIPFRYKKREDGKHIISVRKRLAPGWLVKRHWGPWLLSEGHDPRAFVDECQHWDGGGHDKDKNLEVCCAQRSDAEWTVTMAHLAGKAGCVTDRLCHKPDGSSKVYFFANIRDQNQWSVKRGDTSVSSHKGKVYCPATETGFFVCRSNGHIWVSGNSGKGVQLHNLPRPSTTPEGLEIARSLVTQGALDALLFLFESPMAVLSDLIRSCIIATPGRQLYVADYAAIEARVLAWLAGQLDLLKLFAAGEDVYLDMASAIYRIPAASMNKKTHPDERQLGKTAILGLGFGMGSVKFKDTCELQSIPITGDKAEEVKNIYRTKNNKIVQFWYDLEAAARACVNGGPGTIKRVGYIRYEMKKGFLVCHLPSNRTLWYAALRIGLFKRDDWDEPKENCLTFMGVNSVTRKWERQDTYGGKLCENVTQAVARDLLAEGMLRVEDAGYEMICSVHDELISEADMEHGSVEEFEGLMSTLPDWAKGCPVAAEGYRAERYRK